MHPAMEHLSKLPVGERIELVQDLWDSIAQSREDSSVKEWHRELVFSRLKEFEGREEEIGLTLEQVWERVDARRGS